MKLEIKESDIGSNRISIKQNASGFWYCGELTINCISIIDGIRLMESAIDELKQVLERKNNIEKSK